MTAPPTVVEKKIADLTIRIGYPDAHAEIDYRRFGLKVATFRLTREEILDVEKLFLEAKRLAERS